MIVDDQFLRQPLGVVGHAAGIAQDDLDLLAGDRVAVLLHVEIDGGLDLLAGRGLLPRHRYDEADLDGVLRERAAGGERADGERGNRAGRVFELHWCYLRFLGFVFDCVARFS